MVGEPTGMQMAVAEKGLMVLDCEAKGKLGHAARDEGENAIYKALADIRILQELSLPQKSDLLGPVKISVTMIEAGTQHNVVPDSCRFVVDVRTNECYSNEEIYKIIAGKIESEVKPRSFRLNSSGILLDHPLVKRGIALGLSAYGFAYHFRPGSYPLHFGKNWPRAIRPVRIPPTNTSIWMKLGMGLRFM